MWDIHYCLSIAFGYAYCILLYCLFRVLSWACNRVDDDDDDAHNDHHDHVTSDDHMIITVKELAGIKPSVLRSIPVVDFNSRDFKDGLECVVCLSELVDGDKTRLLPACNHWFHTDCIDPWLQLHSSCPICRSRVCWVQTHDPTYESSLISTLDESPAVIQVTYSGNATSFCVRPL